MVDQGNGAIERVMRIVILCLTTLFLSGCFYSDEVLIGRFRADFPLEDGVYEHTPYDENGVSWTRSTWRGEISRSGGRYLSDVENFPHQGVRMRELGDGVYAVMKPDGDHHVYGLAFVYPGNVVTYHMPSCSALEVSALEVYSVLREEEGYCRVGSWTALSSVLQLYLVARGDSLRMDGIYRLAPDE